MTRELMTREDSWENRLTGGIADAWWRGSLAVNDDNNAS